MSMVQPGDSSVFVLVHSGWLGGWAWKQVAELLGKQGHKAIAPDMPGHGDDHTHPSQVTLDSYVQTVTKILDVETEPAILVGHGFGGVTISQAAEYRPDKVRALVYVCGFLLPSGGSFENATRGVQGSLVLDHMIPSADGSSATVDRDILYAAFAHDIPQDSFTAGRMAAEPMAPLSTPLKITDQRWGRIPRYYIECTEDRVFPVTMQRFMHAATPVQKVFSMATGHVPNLAAPEELATHLMSVASGEKHAAA
jgi:pimeloyl-ACP methyl ester carboxylesterase